MISTKSEVDDDEQWVCKNRMNLRRTRFQFDTEMGKDWFVIGMLHSAHRFVSGAFDRWSDFLPIKNTILEDDWRVCAFSSTNDYCVGWHSIGNIFIGLGIGLSIKFVGRWKSDFCFFEVDVRFFYKSTERERSSMVRDEGCYSSVFVTGGIHPSPQSPKTWNAGFDPKFRSVPATHES